MFCVCKFVPIKTSITMDSLNITSEVRIVVIFCTHLRLVPRSKNGAVPPLRQYAFMAWCSGGAQGQHITLEKNWGAYLYEGIFRGGEAAGGGVKLTAWGYTCTSPYEGVSKSFRIDRLERELHSSLLLGAVVSLFCESV
jgi:hypothetical protein